MLSIKLTAIFFVCLLSSNSLFQEADPVEDLWDWHIYLRRGKKNANENRKNILLKKMDQTYIAYNSPLSYHSWIKGVFPGFV